MSEKVSEEVTANRLRMLLIATEHDGEKKSMARELLALREDKERLVLLLDEAQVMLQTWADEDDCGCDGEGHVCGRPRLLQLINTIRAALDAVEEP